jgi:hypothetical protein
MLDMMGTRYGVLPSQALANGDTLDLHILTSVLEYERSRNNQGKVKTSKEDYSQDELQKLLNQRKKQ